MRNTLDPALLPALVTDAYAVMRRAFHRDEFTPIPPEANLHFRWRLQRRLLRRIGTALPVIAAIGETSKVNASWSGVAVWQALNHDLERVLGPAPTVSQIPRFLTRADALPTVPIDLVALSDACSQLADEPISPGMCLAQSALAWISNLLHLSRAETSLLELAYASSPDGWPVGLGDDGCSRFRGLHDALSAMRWSSNSERNQLLAIVLDLPEAEVAELFEPPWSLAALHLLDIYDWQNVTGMHSYASATDRLHALLETRYQSTDGLLADLAACLFDAKLDADSDVPLDLLAEWAPSTVVDCYECSQRQEPLTAIQLATAVRWWCGLDLPSASFGPLAGRLTFEGVRNHIGRATLSSRKRGVRPTEFDLIKALYDAAASR